MSKKESTSVTPVEVEERVPWLWLIIWTIVYTVVACLVGVFGPGPFYSPLGLQGPAPIPTACFFIPLILFVLWQVAPKIFRLDAKQMGYLYITTAIISMYVGTNAIMAGMSFSFQVNVATSDFAKKYVPWFWMPPKEVLTPTFLGGVAVNWAVWAPMVANWVVFHIIWVFFTMSFVTILRSQWIDVEKLPFPYVVAGASVISIVTGHGGEEKQKISQIKIMGISALIGFLVYLPYVIRVVLPWFPDPFGWQTAGWAVKWFSGGIDFPTFNPDAGKAVVGLTYINLDPFWAILMFLAPLNTLLSGWVGYVVFWILIPQILYSYFGYYTGMATMSGYSRFTTIGYRPPLMLDVFSYDGMMPAIIVFWFILNWKYMASTIRMAVGRGTQKEKSYEREECRRAYLIFLTSAVLCVVYLAACGVEPAPIAVLMAFVIISTFAHARSHAMVGFIGQNANWEGLGYVKAVWPTMTAAGMNQSYVISTILSTQIFATSRSLSSVNGGATMSLHCYSFGSMVGIKPKTVFKIIAATMIIAPIITIPTIVWTWHAFGTTVPPRTPSSIANYIYSFAQPGTYNNRPPITGAGAPDWWPQALAGFILTGILAVLHARFLWFPLEPVGMFVGMSGFPVYGLGIWTSMLFAWIAKIIVLKIGGVKVYERYGVPAACGYIAGQALFTLAYSLTGMYRYFYPA